jgi:hypothetical protein
VVAESVHELDDVVLVDKGVCQIDEGFRKLLLLCHDYLRTSGPSEGLLLFST